MNSAASETQPIVRGQRYLALWAVMIAIGAIGIALKTPFGHYMLHVLGMPIPHQTWTRRLIASEWGWLFWAAVGTLVLYRWSGLRPAPVLERLLYPESRSSAWPKIWRPALLAALLCMVFFVIAQIVGLQAPLLTQLSHIPHASQVKLFTLYPLADVGAALSEETIYRFGGLTILMGLMAFLRVGGRNPNNNVAFWIANVLQALYFGFIHVQQGAVTSQVGGIPLETLIAPPTWAGLILGVVFRTWGFEAAIIAHMAADIFVPIFWAIWTGIAHLI